MTESSADRKRKREVEKLVKGFEQGIRTYEVVQYVSGPLLGSMDDWPARIQDKLFAALEVKSRQEEKPLMVVHSYCEKDIDSTDPKRQWYVHVIASEIVAAIGKRH